MLLTGAPILAISQLLPLGEGKEEPWTAGKPHLKLDALPRSVADEGGDTTELWGLASLEISGDTWQ